MKFHLIKPQTFLINLMTLSFISPIAFASTQKTEVEVSRGIQCVTNKNVNSLEMGLNVLLNRDKLTLSTKDSQQVKTTVPIQYVSSPGITYNPDTKQYTICVVVTKLGTEKY